jgi:RNA polymerase sigma factor (sigma-70 family)
MSTVTNDELSVEAHRAPAGQGREFTPDRIAALLDGWRPRVLREMRRRRLWRGASPAEFEDQFQDVALVLCGRDFASEEHLRRALWTGLGFRAKDFWKAARRREIPVGEFFEGVLGDDRLSAVEDDAAVAADRRYVDDCLSELDPRERSVYKLSKGEQLSRRQVAKTLRLSEAEVLRALYSAQRKIDQVAVVATAGRLCGRRRSAVTSLARGQARGLTLEQARAHLAHCPDCMLAFRAQRAALSRDVAALLPVPAMVAQDQGAGIGALVEHVRGAPGAIKRQLYDLAGRTPGGAADDAIAGAGGLAVGTKVVVTLCVGAAAGGGAICANQLGAFPAPERTQTAKPVAKRPEPRTRPVKTAQAPTVTPDAQGQQADNDASKAPAPTPQPDSSPPAVRKDPPQEFFGGGGSTASGGSNEVQPSAAEPPSGSSSSGGGGGSSQGGGSGGEFFGE